MSASTSGSAQELAVRFLDAGNSSSDAGAAPSSSPIPKQLAAMITSRQAHLLEVVKASAGHLTSEDDKKRGRGIGLLAHVVIRCPKEAVTRQEGKTLSEFFISSLSSPVSEAVLVPALEGLAALAKLPSFGTTEAQTTAKTIFANVDLHGRPQTTRYLCYCLFDVLLAHQRAALKKMGRPFLTGYCALVTGEKDPRNLRLAFSIAKILILEFDIAENVQELFDITFCYFPITFTPPPNDPYGITSEQLQESLRDCLSATPRFGPLALPLFLEKLQATSNAAKKQTLQAFVAAFPVYGKAVITPDAVTIWEAISMEIYHASDSEMEEHALKALKALLETLYPDGTEEALSNDATKSVARRLCDACLLELKDSNKSNAKPASRILARAISASGTLARYLVPKAFGQLLHIYKMPDEIQQRPALFTVMARLLEKLRECPVAIPAEPFLDFREEVLSLCTSSLASSATGSQALDCLVQLVQLPGCLDGDELVFALQSITSLLVSVGSPDVGEDASAAALDGLASVSQLFPKRIEETVLPSLFGRLPDRAPAISDHASIASYRLALACLATLCVLPELFEVLLIRILSRLESTCNFKPEEPAQYAQSALYAHHLLTTLRVVLEKKIAAGHKDVAIRATSITSRLYGLFIPPTLAIEDVRTAATEPRILEDAGRTLMLLVQQLDEKAQRDLNTGLRLAYFENKPTSLLGDSLKKAPERSLAPFGPDASTSQTNLVLLYAFPLYAMRKEVFDSPQELSRLCETLLVEALPRWAGARSIEPSCKLLASLLNKRADYVPDFVDATLPAFWDERIVAAVGDLNSRKAAVTVWAWSMRGLIVRSDNRAYDGVGKLVSLFADEGLSKAAARTMAILSKDNDAVLTKENGAVLRLLYKQRFFSFILPKLVQGYHAAASDASKATPYLVGLSCLLQSMPKQTIITELPKLLPLLLRALELPELDLRAHVIDTLALLVKDTPDAVKHQASTLVSLLLKNATCTDTTKDSEAFIQLRVSALRCLAVFTDTIDWLALHQQKAPVLKALGAIVDDRKKRVRKEAVDCRTRWFLFKAP